MSATNSAPIVSHSTVPYGASGTDFDSAEFDLQEEIKEIWEEDAEANIVEPMFNTS